MPRFLAASSALVLGLFFISSLFAAEPTKATFLVTGLHCPPCTTTVQNSLARVKGVKSAAVNWNAKNAKVEFDESVLPAQSLAAAIDTTPHMMGAGMRYGAWLALKVPSIADEASGQKAKAALSSRRRQVGSRLSGAAFGGRFVCRQWKAFQSTAHRGAVEGRN